jgi:hypothetical protein
MVRRTKVFSSEVDSRSQKARPKENLKPGSD